MSEALFTDEQVTNACGLHVDNLRRLITWGAVKPAQAGGGRGRVRLWNFNQAMHVAATAEFFEAGFSLQMAHTLAYSLPLDDMLRLYDPEFIKAHINVNDRREAHIKRLISPRARNYWMPQDAVGTEIIIVDRKLIYADILGDTPTFFGFIVADRNLFYPTWDPLKFYWGMVSEGIGEPLAAPSISDISRSSLLIDPAYFDEDKTALQGFIKYMTKDIESQIIDPNDFLYRNCYQINLNVGLVITFRKLLGLPVHYPTLRPENYHER